MTDVSWKDIIEQSEIMTSEIVRGHVLDANVEYLEKNILRLETLKLKAKADSTSLENSRARAIARDTEKMCEGMIAGIKFGISFLLYGDGENLGGEDENSIS